ncbi:hypothetical protein F5X68DRAFT_63825 [Plectosphaerella plurivora]|uniref:Uncharacterized protein n=1 Tax=Plectosphaerella plurivora TaxID=936078 RepID=A0A9P9A4X1_9PEZI|nr:hypothetical protein F5X68DRAFT_63825 [Plectosphaerella plurivora]
MKSPETGHNPTAGRPPSKLMTRTPSPRSLDHDLSSLNLLPSLHFPLHRRGGTGTTSITSGPSSPRVFISENQLAFSHLDFYARKHHCQLKLIVPTIHTSQRIVPRKHFTSNVPVSTTHPHRVEGMLVNVGDLEALEVVSRVAKTLGYRKQRNTVVCPVPHKHFANTIPVVTTQRAPIARSRATHHRRTSDSVPSRQNGFTHRSLVTCTEH